ncbi:hypothetical protein L3049_11225 [Labilibaculum sp. DW002]|uniref:Uncharacterized protein n=1 Tax=Paralabilibaculum antarcticum TaxID=2912572 RepID=A0ABT5VT28_9BACT|nr:MULTISPECIES: hypothetical protein [unclassified Labilibaculum]MBI9056877.1 hypothetical protein [Labilibaculum sp.]MDE5418578.1 hypothetical protein [Labilibaculum sp. DW002]
MKRVIKDYKSIGINLIQLLIKNFPDGIYEDDLISISKPNGDKINVIELKTEDTIYLIKMNQELQTTIDSFTGDFEGLDPYSDGYRESP